MYEISVCLSDPNSCLFFSLQDYIPEVEELFRSIEEKIVDAQSQAASVVEALNDVFSLYFKAKSDIYSSDELTVHL